MHLNGEISLQTDGIVDQTKNNYGNRKKIKSQMNKNIRQAVYAKYNGHCAYCGCEIGYKDMQVDHIEPKCRGNERYVGRVGEAAIEVYDTDTPATIKIKEFMALYGIIGIKMRMLKIPGLTKIMGFPEDYVLVGTQAEQKKYIGNAVEVTVARCWCEALCAELNKHFKKANNGRKDIFSESRTDAKSAKGVFQNSLANCTAQC